MGWAAAARGAASLLARTAHPRPRLRLCTRLTLSTSPLQPPTTAPHLSSRPLPPCKAALHVTPPASIGCGFFPPLSYFFVIKTVQWIL
eukprot:3016611-Rhodomonas_salina.2